MSEPQQPSAQPHPPASPYGTPHGAPQYGTPQGAPQYGAPQGAPQGAPEYGAPQGTPQYGAAAPAYGNPLGRTAFLVAVGSGVIGILFSVITPFLYSSGNYDVADSLGTVIGILVLLGGIAAGVLSIIALRRPAPHLLAAIALGIAGSVVIGRVFTWIASLLYYLF
ncbi:MAG TPA: hypothetical protein VFF85_04870 [Microbacterium sp.]|nr:hypothetical protein [Microbacterium sp.]